ncbi:hypothetical protein SPRG_11132 [Saprolegnia parasitica CBS 223.65]|uniref:Uncharacterized protein n=1 Tax=Saprolegnia parasitica (strain CBS 223.65) TaxID=695850 RepID=A0A067BYX0_SAPPC|nr:hypothetical protein SPRG_11132 [Saprolegnia parasitica CBS 223.65]KDO23684.1 hypothetical protein SPRG_11132 [Saprolegnia parasitica CBS 223.65]|eukprot:XP_012205667.1 hypothetical protein SPRG_11132 [Saprolegnia parasitica CBS 223.65]
MRVWLDFATRSAQLESVAWNSCEYFGEHKKCAPRVLRACILAGVPSINTRGVSALAKSLHKTHARVGFQLDLSNNPFRLSGVRVLLTAIATCTNETIKLPLECQESVESSTPHIKKVRAAGVTIDVLDRDIYIRSRTLA